VLAPWITENLSSPATWRAMCAFVLCAHDATAGSLTVPLVAVGAYEATAANIRGRPRDRRCVL